MGYSDRDYLHSFMKTAQYLASLTTHEDVWQHIAEVMVTFYGAESTGFARLQADGGIEFHHLLAPDEQSRAVLASEDIRDSVREVLETGFLAVCSLAVNGEPHKIVLLPISLENKTESVMLVEHATDGPISNDVLNVYLAVSGLAGATINRLTSETELKEHRSHLQQLVDKRTSDLTLILNRLEREIAEHMRAEERLRRNQEWLGVTLSSIGDAVIAADASGNVSFLNPIAVALTGWQTEEAVGQPVRNIFRIINEKTRQPAEDIVSRVLREGCTVALANHTALITRDDREMPIEDSAAPIRDGTGNVIGVVLVFHDVTEKRRAHDSLRESEERFRVMANSIPQLAWIAEADGYVYWYNQRWYDYTGTKPEQMQGWGWQSVHNPETLPGVLERWKDSITTGKPFDMVFPLRGADGSFREFLTRVMPVKDANGGVIRWCGTNTDISEQKRLEADKARLAAIVESSEDAIIGKTLDGIITSWNRGAEEIYGYTAEEVIGRPISVLAQDDHPDELPVMLERISCGEDVKHRETLRTRKDGRSIHVSLTISAIRDASGKIIGASTIARDITEHKRMEMEREITVEILKIVNRSAGMADMVKAAATFFKEQSGCEAVGIRLNEGEDFPYFEARGFPEEFVRLENSLCARDARGNIIRDSLGSPYIECMCGNVILGRVDSSMPFFTPGGSFWANSTTRLLTNTSDEDRQTRTRNRCNGEGYESVALIPLHLGAERLGLMQLNDRRKGMFSAETIAVWERLADHLAVAVAKHRADEALRVNQSRLDLALRSAHMGVWHWDIVENKRWFDDQVCHLLGVDPTQFSGTADAFFNVVHPDDRAAVKAALARSIEQDAPYETEYRAVWADRSVHYITARGKVIQDDKGRPVRINGLLWDTTEHKQMEEELRKSRDELELRVHERTVELQSYMKKLEESNEALRDFASIASHDLQEPLRKVKSFGGMLKQKCGDSLGEEGSDYLDRVLNANQRMQSLLSALLEYSRLSTKTDPFVEVEPAKIIREVLSDLEVRIVNTGGEVHVGAMPVISADPTQMRQLFQNLIGNALKFHKEGQNPIVQVRSVSGTDSGCQIIVEDNGIGFEERYLEKIFAPFHRLHGKASRYEGTGMGLAICKKIVERHGGSITATSTPGEGATFIIELPLKQNL